MTRDNRFWSAVDVRSHDDCWPWTMSTSSGYGQLRREGRKHYAHRYAWELKVGEIPNGSCVCHRCDNRLCCNPEHMFLGSIADNLHDMAAKGRACQGEGHHCAVLTVADVIEIRASRQGSRALAAKYGVSPRTIRRARRGDTWKGVDA